MMRFHRIVALLTMLWLFAAIARGQTLEARIKPLVEAHHGTVAVAVKHLPSGESFEYQAELPLPTASLIKLPVMIAVHDAVHAGKLDLAKPLILREEDKVPGSGILSSNFSSGVQLPLRDALRLMIVFSDNTATNLVIDQLGLPATARLMETLGCPQTKLNAKVYRGDTSIFPERSKQFGLGSTTAREMVSLLERLDRGEVIDREASQAMKALLLDNADRTMLVRDLPASVRVAHKSGAVANVRTDAGIIDAPTGSIAICVLTNENEDKSWADDNAAHLLIGRIARAAFDHFNPNGVAESEEATRDMKLGAVGDLVEALQRTLNDRLQPSMNLATDGDFGPMTQKAVIAFQKQQGLKETGVVDADTWKALGTLMTDAAPVPDPEVVNAEVLPRQPQESLVGPPDVTCKAWAIGDARTGKLLWGDHESERLHPASTTKIMTAYLVTSLAEQDPSVMDEVVTFSSRADQTVGSTAGLKAGEQVSVRELLYGMLLPSGNDASVAFAEHFGARCSLEGGSATEDASQNYDAFIAAMDERARHLGMRETSYVNTHGLTDDQHLTSARDLLVLSQHAMAQPEFCARTSTIQRGCRVRSTSGYERNVVWQNTNQMLQFEGFDGVKTGTTEAAGCCLVTRGERDGKPLIVVVLGAPSTESRYVDTRNLFRWAWLQLTEGGHGRAGSN